MASFMNSMLSDFVAVIVVIGFIILIYSGISGKSFEEAAASLRDKIFGVKEKK